MGSARPVMIRRNYFRTDCFGCSRTKQMVKDLIMDVNFVEHLKQTRMTCFVFLVQMD